MTTDMLVLNLLAQGWPLSPKMIEDIERAWPEFQRRVINGAVDRVFCFSRIAVSITSYGLFADTIGAAGYKRAHFWFDIVGYEGSSPEGRIVIQNQDGPVCIPEFPESWRG